MTGQQTEVYVGWYGKERRQDWTTPRMLFDAWNYEWAFDLDGAAEPGNSLLPEGSTREHPVSWSMRRVFCNPPWNAIAPFVEQAPEALVAVLLVPARVNAKWFHRALDLGATPRYFLGRPSFGNGAHDGPGHNSPVDCLLLVWDDR